MQTYVTFLRGVNMTGHNSIKMTVLAELFGKLSFGGVETYIQSGNVVFTTPGTELQSALALKIEKAIMEHFGFDVPSMIRTDTELAELSSINPYLNEPGFDPARMAVLFLHDEPSDAQIQKVAGVDYPPDKFKISGREIFIYCPNGFGKTRLYTNFFEKKMGVIGTARNWKTVTTLLGIAKKKLSVQPDQSSSYL